MFYQASMTPAAAVALNESGDIVVLDGSNTVSALVSLATEGLASACTYARALQLLPSVDLSESFEPPAWLDVTGDASCDAMTGPELAAEAQGVAVRLELHGLREAARHADHLTGQLVSLAQIGDLPDGRIAKQTTAIARQISSLRAAIHQLEM